MSIDTHLLSLLIFVPLIGAIFVMLVPAVRRHKEGDSGAVSAAVVVTTATTLIELILAARLWWRFDPSVSGFQFRVAVDWISAYRIRYDIGIDGVSLLMIGLTAFLTLLSVVYSWTVQHRTREYMVFLLVLETAMMGVFCALDLVLFYVFWELVLIPMYFLIGIWGHERRIYAAVKFFLYTFAGSILMLVAIVLLYVHTRSFSIVEMAQATSAAGQGLAQINPSLLLAVYGAFALAFMIKVPMFPFHTWLPDAHVEAPTAGSVLLAGVLLKMGMYGFLRICMPLMPAQMASSAPLFLILGAVGAIYGALVAAVQPDMKKLVAYSSVSHLGLVMIGVFSFNALGLYGAVLQSVNHGVSTGLLFFLVGMLYDRRHSRDIAAFGGLRRVVPVLSATFMIAAFSSAALPLTNGFVGEFMILQGAYLSNASGPLYAALGATCMVLSAVYMLWLYQRAFSGPVVHNELRTMRDLDRRERLVVVPLVVLVFWFGCYVAPWLRPLPQAVTSVLAGFSGDVSRGSGAR